MYNLASAEDPPDSGKEVEEIEEKKLLDKIAKRCFSHSYLTKLILIFRTNNL
jgi:hypothetical protein